MMTQNSFKDYNPTERNVFEQILDKSLEEIDHYCTLYCDNCPISNICKDFQELSIMFDESEEKQ